MSLVDRMTTVYDRVYGISDRFGVNMHTDFSYKNRITGVVTAILPRPRIGNPPVHKLMQWEKQGTVDVNNNDKYITGISRTFEGITEGTICTVAGKEHTILWIDREQTVTFNILVRPERSR